MPNNQAFNPSSGNVLSLITSTHVGAVKETVETVLKSVSYEDVDEPCYSMYVYDVDVS